MPQTRSTQTRDNLLRVTQEADGRVVVLHVAGEIDLTTRDALAEALTNARAAAAPALPVVVNLGGVQFLSSVGLALLQDHHQRCAEAGVPLRVVADQRAVLRPVQLTGLDRLLDIYPSVAEATAAGGGDSTPTAGDHDPTPVA